MLSHLKIRDLELVVALHEAGSVTEAAKRVGISDGWRKRDKRSARRWESGGKSAVSAKHV
jgi:hypothetical protein